jgi:hypothetical protein
VALPLRHIELHHANDDCSTQCVLILALMSGTVKGSARQRLRSAVGDSDRARAGLGVDVVEGGPGWPSPSPGRGCGHLGQGSAQTPVLVIV